jgi:tRNA modification GTPase
VATAPGRGAVGIVRLSGPEASGIATRLCGTLPSPRRAALRQLRDERGAVLDQGLVLVFPAPDSYTGEDVVELQGHGGPVVLDLLARAACAFGARPARAGEFSERAFLNDRIDLAQAEAVADLIDASSRASVIAAQRSLDGEFSRRIDALAQTLLELRIHVEGALDFSDEDIDWLGDEALHGRVRQLLEDLDALSRAAARGRRLREGLVVAIAGQPNVGKSSLLNALAGTDAAIVTDIPGTTRDPLREHILIDGLPLTVIDTAGLRDSDDPVEREGIRRAWQMLEQAELTLYVADDRTGLSDTDAEMLRRLPQNARVLLIYNKSDLSSRAPGKGEDNGQSWLRLSAATGAGLESLREALSDPSGTRETGESAFSARRRHVLAIEQARLHAGQAHDHLRARSSAELAAEELRLAHEALGEITGRVSTEDLLGAVFSRFCIGK